MLDYIENRMEMDDHKSVLDGLPTRQNEPKRDKTRRSGMALRSVIILLV
jgi:hypothetical protein